MEGPIDGGNSLDREAELVGLAMGVEGVDAPFGVKQAVVVKFELEVGMAGDGIGAGFALAVFVVVEDDKTGMNVD